VSSRRKSQERKERGVGSRDIYRYLSELRLHPISVPQIESTMCKNARGFGPINTTVAARDVYVGIHSGTMIMNLVTIWQPCRDHFRRARQSQRNVMQVEKIWLCQKKQVPYLNRIHQSHAHHPTWTAIGDERVTGM
jgi:hypothetical protein